MTEKVTRMMAILANCHQCMGFYKDGKVDCENESCPLYTFMPYRKKEPVLDWAGFNPKRSGLVTWEDSKREIDDETRALLAERLSAARGARGAGSVEDGEDDEDDE